MLLYAGDVVNLSAYTMTKYGSLNGEVRTDTRVTSNASGIRPNGQADLFGVSTS